MSDEDQINDAPNSRRNERLAEKRIREANRRSLENEQQRERRKRLNRIRTYQIRSMDTMELRRERLAENAMRQQIQRSQERNDQIQRRRHENMLRQRNFRANESDEQTQQRRQQNVVCQRNIRSRETQELALQRRQRNLLSQVSIRSRETEEQALERRQRNLSSQMNIRSQETDEQALERRQRNLSSQMNIRSQETDEQALERRQRNLSSQMNIRSQETDEQVLERRQRNLSSQMNIRSQETDEQALERRQRNLSSQMNIRSQETEEQTLERRQRNLSSQINIRSQETEEQTLERRLRNQTRQQVARSQETNDQIQQRRQQNMQTNRRALLNESVRGRQIRLGRESSLRVTRRRQIAENISFQEIQSLETENRNHVPSSIAPQMWNKAAFAYNPAINYGTDKNVSIGKPTLICQCCQAKKWPTETLGMCCSGGKISLNKLPEPPLFLQTLLTGETNDSKNFLRNIRKYNGAFQMTSFGAKIVSETNFMPTFKVEGQVCHRIGSLLPSTNEEPKFLQIYFVEDFNLQAQSRSRLYPDLKIDIIRSLQDMLHQKNSYILSFKSALEMQPSPNLNIVIDADKRPSEEHQRRFNAPVCNEVAVIISDAQHGSRDIVLRYRDDRLLRISETHRSYDTLQYPLIFVNGEDGYHFGIPQIGSNKTVSCKDFYAYHFMVRDNEFNMLHRFKALFQQFVVDMFAKMEAERLCYIRTHQKELRVDSYIHLRDNTTNDGNNTGRGQLCILPSSYTGSPRYMHEKTQDAMTYVRCFGCPDLFITFTCNPLWHEISDELFPGQTSHDRHDIMSRVFQLKLKTLMKLVTKLKIFGSVQCHMYTVEWQKRGLPHAHILIWLKEKLHSSNIDQFISAELPDPEMDPVLFQTITKQMIHGPCGAINPSSPCMKDGKCSKKFPKKFVSQTQTDQDGYPLYRRRNPIDGGFKTKLILRGNREVNIDNRWIVPYCPLLSRIFNAHINVEFCNSVKSIKYVCKYINKGSDAAMYSLNQQSNIDEVTQFQMGRYISSNEAFWRFFGFDIHSRYPAIQHLSVHLENGQRIYFTEETLQGQLQNPKDTTLTAFFKICREDSFAKTLLYNQMPSYFTWKNNKWSRRKRGIQVEGHSGIKFDNTMGRVYTVHPNQQECFYLRMLLHEIRGPISFESIRTVDGFLCSTYRETCMKLGLLENDSQWENTLAEAVITNSPRQLRRLFALLIRTCELNSPLSVWLKFRNDMSEDYRH